MTGISTVKTRHFCRMIEAPFPLLGELVFGLYPKEKNIVRAINSARILGRGRALLSPGGNEPVEVATTWGRRYVAGASVDRALCMVLAALEGFVCRCRRLCTPRFTGVGSCWITTNTVCGFSGVVRNPKP